MSLLRRLAKHTAAGFTAALAPAADPRPAGTPLYERQVQLQARLQSARREVSTSRLGLDAQAARLQDRAGQLYDEARVALLVNREDLARGAMLRRVSIMAEQRLLGEQIARITREEQQLLEGEQRVLAVIEEHRVRREAVAARYSAAEVQVRVSEALSGLSHDLSDLGLTLAETEADTADLQARAAAIDDLMDSRVLPGGTQSRYGESAIGDFALIEMESELAALKRTLGQTA